MAKKLKGTDERPRLIVYRSNKTIYGQIVDDVNHKTLITISGQSKDLKTELLKTKGKVDQSKLIGQKLGEKAKKLKISKVLFDRNGYLYHGRVKALADGARESGLEF